MEVSALVTSVPTKPLWHGPWYTFSLQLLAVLSADMVLNQHTVQSDLVFLEMQEELSKAILPSLRALILKLTKSIF